MSNPFAKASKKQAKLRMALVGPSGSGKTYTAIKMASVFGKVAVIDTEHGSASKYADVFGFDVVELHNFDPREYIQAINAAAQYGYDAVVIDSLSHSWKDLLAQKNTLDAKGGNSYVNWGKITPKQDALIEAILAAPIHVIATMRAKMDHVIEKDERGNTTVRKVGLAPIQRDDVEYEFDIVADMDISNNMIVSKSRCSDLSGKLIAKPGQDVANIIKNWLTDGAVAPVQPPPTPIIDADFKKAEDAVAKLAESKPVENAPQSRQEAPFSDLQQQTASVVVDTPTAAETAKAKLGTPPKQTVAPKSGRWAFDRNALLSSLATHAKDTSYQERGNTVKAMDTEGAFANCADLAEATQLVVARLATHKKEAVG